MKRQNIYYVIACLILLSTIAYVTAQGSQQTIPLITSFEMIPLKFKEYAGQNMDMSRETTQYGSADDWTFREYRARNNGLSMQVFVGYWANQDEQKSIKSPRYMEGAQYSFKQRTIISGQNDVFRVNSFVHDEHNQKKLIYYCFFMDAKTIPDDYQFRFLRMVNTLLYRKNNAALLRVSIPIPRGFLVESAEVYIEEFLKDFLPIVKGYLPI